MGPIEDVRVADLAERRVVVTEDVTTLSVAITAGPEHVGVVPYGYEADAVRRAVVDDLAQLPALCGGH